MESSGNSACNCPTAVDGGVGQRGDAEEQLVFARVGLAAVAAKGVDHAGVETLEGFENADAGGKGRQRRAALRQKDPAAIIAARK